MKVLTTILFMTMAILSTSCKGDDDSPTISGNNESFSVEIDGKDYNPEFVEAYPLALNSVIVIDANQMDNTNVSLTFPFDAKAGDTFTADGLQLFFAAYTIGDGDGVDASEGSVTITAHDTNARKISGTFSFITMPNDAGKSVTFTNGTFDVSYAK